MRLYPHRPMPQTFHDLTETPGGQGSPEQLQRMFTRYRFAAGFCAGKDVVEIACGAGQGLPSMYEASMGKCFANEMVIDVTNAAMQIFGGYGYSKEFPVERMLRDARAWGVAGGTVQMLRITLASVLYGRRFDQRRGK